MISTLSLLGVVGLASYASAECSRAILEDATTAYFKAQAAGQPSLLLLASNVSYAENDVPLDITKGVLSQAITIDFNRSIHDTTQCAAFTEITAAKNNGHPYVINARFLLTDGKITKFEHLVADTGDWAFDAAGHLSWTKKEKWDVIPEAKRDTRAVIQAAGDAYLDSWENGKVSVPYGTPCARLEGGFYTGDKKPDTNTCKMPEFPKPFIGCKNRRYVIDETVGAVGIFNDFPFIEKTKPDGTPSMNLLRVEGGKIRYIHETTVCATKNCGR